jgi:hypothetical protein
MELKGKVSDYSQTTNDKSVPANTSFIWEVKMYTSDKVLNN